MNPTEAKVEEAIDKMDEGKQDDQQQGQPVAPVKDEDKQSDAPKGEEDKKVEEPGYSIDDLDKEDEPEAPKEDKKTEAAPVDTSGLDAEGKYIVDNLPEVVARIKDANGAVKELRVKAPSQLPEDFEFASKRDEMLFNNAMNAQEYRALQLQNDYRNQQSTKQNQEFEAREAAGIREDIARLQGEGVLPKFKEKLTLDDGSDNPKFDSDPAAKQVQQVIDFMEKRNQTYLKAYQEGKAPFRHIGFEEAFYLSSKGKPQSQAQQKEDDERQDIARKTTPNQGLSANKTYKPTVKSGTTIQDILDRIDVEL